MKTSNFHLNSGRRRKNFHSTWNIDGFGRQKREKCVFDENDAKVNIFTLFTFRIPMSLLFRKNRNINFSAFCASAGPAANPDRQTDRQRLDPAAAPPAHAGNSYPVGGLPRPPTPIKIMIIIIYDFCKI